MTPYLSLLSHCLETGVRQKNRTNVDTLMIPGGMMQFDLAEGFPILTTKRIAFASVVGETIGFIRGYDNARDFRQLKCMYWDKNANQNKTWLDNPYRQGEDDLGRIYGVQWRNWGGADDTPTAKRGFDQLRRLLQMIENDPTSRRLIVTAWNPIELHLMALPPCHLLFQILIEQEKRRMHMTMTMRSCDMFLGVPMNITSYALLLSLIAMVTGYEPGKLTMFLSDVHIYVNHIDQVKEQLKREPKPRPRLVFSDAIAMDNDWPTVKILESIEPWDISLSGYDPHPAIKGEMAV